MNNKTVTPIKIAIMTVSDSRTESDDTSGDALVERLTGAGHTLVEKVIIADVKVNSLDDKDKENAELQRKVRQYESFARQELEGYVKRSKYQLVEKAATIVTNMGATLMTPAEVREKLQLKKRSPVNC